MTDASKLLEELQRRKDAAQKRVEEITPWVNAAHKVMIQMREWLQPAQDAGLLTIYGPDGPENQSFVAQVEPSHSHAPGVTVPGMRMLLPDGGTVNVRFDGFGSWFTEPGTAEYDLARVTMKYERKTASLFGNAVQEWRVRAEWGDWGGAISSNVMKLRPLTRETFLEVLMALLRDPYP